MREKTSFNGSSASSRVISHGYPPDGELAPQAKQIIIIMIIIMILIINYSYAVDKSCSINGICLVYTENSFSLVTTSQLLPVYIFLPKRNY